MERIAAHGKDFFLQTYHLPIYDDVVEARATGHAVAKCIITFKNVCVNHT